MLHRVNARTSSRLVSMRGTPTHRSVGPIKESRPGVVI